jgi:hypothetical protein
MMGRFRRAKGFPPPGGTIRVLVEQLTELGNVEHAFYRHFDSTGWSPTDIEKHLHRVFDPARTRITFVTDHAGHHAG